MIALHSDCLIFQLINGESVPCSADMISVEIVGSSDMFGALDPKTLRHAAASVFHYFKTELERETVTVGEFAQALEKALQGLGLTLLAEKCVLGGGSTLEANLAHLARDDAFSLELFFFPRLRDEMRTHLGHAPRVLRFYGLRGCVKQLAGARRWSSRCEQIAEQIVDFMRQCLSAEPQKNECALVVE